MERLFKLTCVDDSLNEVPEVKEWLDKVADRMHKAVDWNEVWHVLMTYGSSAIKIDEDGEAWIVSNYEKDMTV